MTRDEALEVVDRVVPELMRTHREYAMVAGQAKRKRVAAYFDSAAGDSVSARDRFADHMAVDLDVEAMKLRCEIAALEVELDHARFVVTQKVS